MGQAFPAPTFGHAAEAFAVAHAAPGAWSAGTAVKYRQTLAALGAQLARTAPAAARDVAVLGTPAGAAALNEAFAAAFGGLAPATRARHLAALRSALAWCAGGWLDGDPAAGWARSKVPADTTRALTRAQVAAIWRLGVPLRDKALWRMLYETAGRAAEILGLDVPDLDLPGKRGRVTSKGGTADWVYWQTGTALLLPRLLAGRAGPVFLTARKPAHAVASADLCPVTGRARLSYRRAEETFELATRPLAHPGARPEELEDLHGWTLHQLRHCSPTRPKTAPAPPCCSPGPGTPPSAPSSATPAPAPKPSPATSPPPTQPPGAARPDAKRCFFAGNYGDPYLLRRLGCDRLAGGLLLEKPQDLAGAIVEHLKTASDLLGGEVIGHPVEHGITRPAAPRRQHGPRRSHTEHAERHASGRHQGNLPGHGSPPSAGTTLRV